jgi:DHA1 family bicyclomycin/chloramphenicol resistance-like MFS transporter
MHDTPERRTARKMPSIGILIAVSMLQPIGINMYIPSIPGMRVAFGTDATTIQLTISLYLLATALAMLVLGPLSDRLGRRPVMLGGLALFVVGSLVCVLAPNVWVLIAARVLQAIGASAGIALARAVVRDVYDREQSASMIGYVTMGMAVAPMVAPAIGGLLDESFGWRASFQAMTGFGVAVLAYAWVALDETNPRGGDSRAAVPAKRLIASFGALLATRAFAVYAGVATVASMVFFAFIGGAPHVSTTLLKLTPSAYGAYFALIAIGYIIGNFFSGRYAARLGLRRMIHAGNVVSLAGIAIAAAFALGEVLHPLAFFGPMLFLSVGNGLTLPSSIAGAVSVRPDLAGAAAGLTGSLQVGLGAVMTVVVGALSDADLLPGTAWFVLIPMLAAAVGALLVALAVPRAG